MDELPPDLLDRPAQSAARLLALVRVDELFVARTRLDDSNDAEATHDFHVALRRLRSMVRSYGDVLGDSASQKIRRHLKRLSDAAGASRDAQVHMEWLAAQAEELSDGAAEGAAWIERRLRRDRRRAGRKLQRALERSFADVTERLERRLVRYRVTYGLDDALALPTGRQMIGETLHALADALRTRAELPQTIADMHALHRTRIAAKRLRYALEVLVEGKLVPPRVARSASAVIAHLKTMQDALGAVHDAHELGRWLADRAAEDAAKRARRDAAMMLVDEDDSGGDADAPDADQVDLQPFILVAHQRLREQAERSYAPIASAAHSRRMARLFRSVHTVADRLASARI